MASSSDTEMDSESSSSDYSVSTGEDSPDASPRPVGGDGDGGGPPAAASVPALRVPSLSLRNLAALPRGDEPGSARPSSARPPCAVPRLALPGARAAVPPPTTAASPPITARGGSELLQPAATVAPREAQQQRFQLPLPPQRASQQPASASQDAPLSLDVLSPAFSLQRSQQNLGGDRSSSSQLVQRCVDQLGVPSERLRYYSLVEVAGPQHLPPGCTRAAVEVLDSSFSLSALEELVAENQRLKAEAQLQQQRDIRPADGAAGAADVWQLHEQLQRMQLENNKLRQQMRQSESLRRKGKKALQEIKKEFEALSRALMVGQASGLVLGKGPAQQLALMPYERLEPAGTPATPAALSDALQQL